MASGVAADIVEASAFFCREVPYWSPCRNRFASKSTRTNSDVLQLQQAVTRLLCIRLVGSDIAFDR
jgi:hypothetical protein